MDEFKFWQIYDGYNTLSFWTDKDRAYAEAKRHAVEYNEDAVLEEITNKEIDDDDWGITISEYTMNKSF